MSEADSVNSVLFKRKAHSSFEVDWGEFWVFAWFTNADQQLINC